MSLPKLRTLAGGMLMTDTRPFDPALFHDAAIDRHIGAPTGPGPIVPEDRPGCVFRQFAFDRPHHFLALLLVEFHRLPVDHLVELRIAVAVIVALRPASE